MDLRKAFRDELSSVQEDNPHIGLQEQINMAVDRVTESAGRIIRREGDRHYWEHVENVHKAFFC